MAKNIAIFVDIPNLYYKASKKFEGRKIDYSKLLDRLKEEGDVFRAIAYGTQRDKEAIPFITCLKHLGFETKYKEPKSISIGDKTISLAAWEVGMTCDIIRVLDKVDTVILVSGNNMLEPTVRLVQERGVPCIVAGCGISIMLRKAATRTIEFSDSILEACAPESAEMFRDSENEVGN